MNLWQENITEKIWQGVRFSIWGVLAIDVALFCLFSLWFVIQTLVHLRGWCARTLFSGDW